MPPRKALLDSDSDPDQPLTSSRPSDKQLAKALRDVVANTFKSGKVEELTVKRMRLAAEKALGIEEGFFRADSVWKARSDQIIKDEVVSWVLVMVTEEMIIGLINTIREFIDGTRSRFTGARRTGRKAGSKF